MRDVDQNLVDFNRYDPRAEDHAYMEDLAKLPPEDARKLLDVGVSTGDGDRAGTFLQMDRSVVHCKTTQPGVEILGITEAAARYDWLDDYLWRHIKPDQDTYTAHSRQLPHEGYFIRAEAGVRVSQPVQSCLYIAKQGFAQNVHNVVIAEPGADLHIITGCATAPHLTAGLHIGISEFYVKKGARLTFTMIHDWGEKVDVRPRSVTVVEEGGVLVSNYISLRPLGSLQMFPTTYLKGPGAVGRFNSILVASRGSHLDVGSRIVLEAPETRAEIISRAITYGGDIIARGDLVGKAAGIKAHLECKGLILNDGLMQAIPELTGHVPGVEMSHEAAVGKIDRGEIEYLMARGLDEETAVSTIVRGFLNVDIEGLPPRLQARLDQAIADTQHDMM
jgi:Fe-S cluster assembly scaffold protein SufB